MNIDDTQPGALRFAAHPPFWGSKVAAKTTPAWQKNAGKANLFMAVGVFAFTAVLIGLWVGLQSLTEGSAEWVQANAFRGFQVLCLGLLGGGASAGTGGRDAG